MIDVEPARLLGIPEGVESPHSQLQSTLNACGLNGGATEDLRCWLALASFHTSHLYENSHDLEEVGAKSLTMLQRLGRSYADLVCADTYVKVAAPATAGAQSSDVVRMATTVRQELGQWLRSLGAAQLGKGEAANGGAASVYEQVAYQVLGALALHGCFSVAATLLETVCPSLTSVVVTRGESPVSELEREFSRTRLTWTYREDGPDHARVFTAVVDSEDGRQAEGRGPSKKAARSAAAQAFLGRFARRQRAAAEAVSARSVPPLCYSAPGNAHRQTVADLRAMFELDQREEPWLTQALTHTSWAYENKRELASARQRDNTFLAHHGSLVAAFLAALNRCRNTFSTTLDPDKDQARITGINNEWTHQLGQALNLDAGLLLGRGETGRERSRLLDGATQSVLAVAWRAHENRLLQRRPDALDRWLEGLGHELDSFTQLQQICSAYGMGLDHEFEVTGPDHQSVYHCRLTMTSHRRTLTWQAKDGGRGHSAAKIQASREVLDIITADLVSENHAWNAQERALACGMLLSQIEGAAALSQRAMERAIARGDLGMAALVTGDTRAFAAWAEAASELVGGIPEKLAHAMSPLYRAAVRYQRIGHTSPLARARRALGEGSEAVARRLAAQATSRALDHPLAADLRGAVVDWWRSSTAKVALRISDEWVTRDRHLLPQQTGALTEVLEWCAQAAAAAGRAVNIELAAPDENAHVLIELPGVDVPATCNALTSLLNSTVPFFSCTPDEDRVLLELTQPPEPASLPALARVGLDAYTNSAPRPRQAGVDTAAISEQRADEDAQRDFAADSDYPRDILPGHAQDAVLPAP
ncbi:putative dsRNA-binding protein [Kitasatospora sp. NPDC088346]|uniref:putative dsRNA-binding protein n=1 Tax=Kitasatospora sp. NPDC088346 TaxID=3364073 RepID=UPI00381C3075